MLYGGAIFAADIGGAGFRYAPSGGSDDHKPTPTPSPSPTASPTPSLSPTPTPSPQTETRLEIDLAGASLNGAVPRGEAELRRRADGSREFEVRVQNVNLAAGTLLNVLVDGAKVGTITLAPQLTGAFELDTRDGRSLPPVVNGTTVAVTDQSGATLLAGAFAATLQPPGPTPTPSPAPTPQPGAETRLRIPLAGAVLNGVVPKGRADFRQRADGRRQIEVEIEDVNLPAGTTFTVLVDQSNVGQIALGQFFKGALELETENGQAVPAVKTGTTVAVVGPSGATLVAGEFGADASSPARVNPLEDASFFVRQQYIDFLNRAPEAGGFDAWLRVLDDCATNDARCDRVQISSDFFRSQEFLGRGYFIYRAYDAALGRLPLYSELMPELGRFGTAQDETQLEARKSAFIDDVMRRQEFAARYAGEADAAHAEDFVSHLERTAGVRLANHAQLVADMRGGAHTAAQTLRAFLDSPEVNERFYPRAFVAMQYFGYLRRDPEAAGYNAWLNAINANPSDTRTMVNGFVNSTEYRARFGQP